MSLSMEEYAAMSAHSAAMSAGAGGSTADAGCRRSIEFAEAPAEETPEISEDEFDEFDEELSEEEFDEFEDF